MTQALITARQFMAGGEREELECKSSLRWGRHQKRVIPGKSFRERILKRRVVAVYGDVVVDLP